ncbi:DUF6295 family protein [Tenggerimyces flavus]|uniref:DUF6295 family protein n=1 Tax=Tenggerimyces flavus TaxID=1708749 RepID=A0ABV7YAW0_9ACTN|nr:DUF6295 family protein [Tenggerimyces flavus]MBM7789796.1 hypothetical protein [Tenggerimyces flavus]
MCTTIANKVAISGSAKGSRGWFAVDQVCVSYDHPFHIDLEHAMMLDFVDAKAGPDARVAIELDRESARALAAQLLAAADEADAYEGNVTVAAS